jgi:hypothetical protein
MTTPKKMMTAKEAKVRSKHTEWIVLAALTARGYGKDELAVQLDALAEVVRTGGLEFDIERTMDW